MVDAVSAERLSKSQREEVLSAINNIHLALAPRIAVLSSPDVGQALAPNGFSDFTDLLRPFQDSIEGVSVRTSQLETRLCQTFPLSFDGLDQFGPSSSSSSSLFTPADALAADNAGDGGIEPPPATRRSSTAARPEVLLDAISSKVSARSRWLDEDVDAVGSDGRSEAIEDRFDADAFREAPLEKLTPWFAESRDMVFRARSVSEHESFGHPVAILLVVSASSTDPMNAFASLFEASQPHVTTAFSKRPYIDPLVLRYYVLLHDVSQSGPDLSESISLLENVKKTYGLYCCLLPINSANSTERSELLNKSPGISDIWQRALQNDPRAPLRRPNIRTPAEAEHSSEFAKGEVESESEAKPVPTRKGRGLIMSEDKAKRDEGRWRTPPGRGDDDENEDHLGMTSESKQAWKSSLAGSTKEFDSSSDTQRYGRLLDDDDVKRIKAFVRELAAQNIVPFLERCVSLWNEQLAASRRGLTGRLFGAGRKLFATASNRGSPTQPTPSFANMGFYPHSSLEAQTRRLADFAFTTRDYKLAAAMYDLGRKDYANDKAYKYLAGANEMFGLAHLMMMLGTRTNPVDVDSYLSSACHNYTVAPRRKGSALQTDSLRATLLFYEAYRALSYYRSAPTALVRTAMEGSGDSENDIEVAGALLLEQAAICDMRQSGRPALRKCALHLIMAAHRYGSCGQKHLSYRCFCAAATVYRGQRRSQGAIDSVSEAEREKGGLAVQGGDKKETEDEGTHLFDMVARSQGSRMEWRLIEDHTEHQLAEQANNDGNVEQAIAHFWRLVRRQGRHAAQRGIDEDAKQHAIYLNGLLTSCKYISRPLADVLEHHNLPLSLSLVDKKSSYIRTSTKSLPQDPMWRVFSSVANLDTDVASSASNMVTVDETFEVALAVVNPLAIPLMLNGLTVEFDRLDGVAVDGKPLPVRVETVTLEPRQHRSFSVAVRSPDRTGSFRCARVRYTLQGQINIIEVLDKHGRRLNDTKAQRSSTDPIYARDETLTVVVHEPKPKLEARLTSAPGVLGLGEEVKTFVELHNAGKVPLRNVVVVASRYDVIMSFEAAQQLSVEAMTGNDVFEYEPMIVELPKGELGQGSKTSWPVLVRGTCLGPFTIRLVFKYEALNGGKYQTWLEHHVRVEPVVDIAVHAGPSRCQDSITYDVRLDAVNLSPSGERVTIDHISVLSPSWRAVPAHSNNDQMKSLESLESRQGRSTAFTVSRSDLIASEREASRYTGEHLSALLLGRDIDKSSKPPSLKLTTTNISSNGAEATGVTPFVTPAKREWQRTWLARQFASIPDELRRRIFAFHQPNDVDIIAHWTMSASKRQGQVFVFGLQLGPGYDHFHDILEHPSQKGMRTIYAQAAQEKAAILNDLTSSRLHIEEEPIVLDMESPASLVHDFEKISRAIFTVPLLVRNLSSVRSVEFTLQLDDGAHTDQQRASWIDRLTFRGSLEPLSHVILSAKASVCSAGRSELGAILVRTFVKGPDRTQGSVSSIINEFARWEECTRSIDVLQLSR